MPTRIEAITPTTSAYDGVLAPNPGSSKPPKPAPATRQPANTAEAPAARRHGRLGGDGGRAMPEPQAAQPGLDALVVLLVGAVEELRWEHHEQTQGREHQQVTGKPVAHVLHGIRRCHQSARDARPTAVVDRGPARLLPRAEREGERRDRALRRRCVRLQCERTSRATARRRSQRDRCGGKRSLVRHREHIVGRNRAVVRDALGVHGESGNDGAAHARHPAHSVALLEGGRPELGIHQEVRAVRSAHLTRQGVRAVERRRALPGERAAATELLLDRLSILVGAGDRATGTQGAPFSEEVRAGPGLLLEARRKVVTGDVDRHCPATGGLLVAGVRFCARLAGERDETCENRGSTKPYTSNVHAPHP